MIRKFGWRSWRTYQRARREGWIVNYGAIFTRDELAILGEHFAPAPWERRA
jgi:hypothetical protein